MSESGPTQRPVECRHAQRREIAEPQKNVERGELIDLRLWFCFDCGEKWETREKLGDVDSVELRVNLKAAADG